MYRVDDPLLDPAFFSFNSHHDVNRLGCMLGIEIVIYAAKSYSSLSNIEIFHDFRSLSSRLRPRPEVYFLITPQRELYRLDSSLDFQLEGQTYFFCELEQHTCLSSETGFSQKEALKAASFLLDLPDPLVSLENGLEDLLEASLDIELPSKISKLGIQLYDLWQEKIIFVSYCRNLTGVNSRHLISPFSFRKKNPSNYYFSTLMLVAPACSSMKELDLEKVQRVVCFYGGRNLCLLKSEYVQKIVESCLETLDRDKPIAGNFLKIPKVTRLETEAEREEKKKGKKPTRADLKEKMCKCRICMSSDFSDNMSKAGPEQLCLTPYSICELLELLGLNSEKNLKIVDRMCELSVASMDIESMTLTLDLNPPQSSSRFPYSQIDSAHLEAHYKKVQKPIMISHVDALTFELPASSRLTLTAASDDEESFYEMMKLYWNKILELQNACRQEKKKIVKPLMEILCKYKAAFFQESSEWLNSLSPFDEDTGIFCEFQAKEVLEIQEAFSLSGQARTWWQLLPGQLESQLIRLQHDYNVFSFYG